MKNLSKRKSTNYQVCYSPKNANAIRSKSMNSNPNITKSYRVTPYRACIPPQPIPSYLKREKNASNNNNNDNNSKPSTPLINDSYCNDLRDQLMNEGIFIEDIEYNDLPNLSEHLREYAASKSFERDYTTAKVVRELYDQVKEKMKFRNTYSTPPTNNNNENQNDHLIEDKVNEQQDELKKFDEETEEKLQQLQQKHDEETEHFEKKWREELPQSYRKQSSKLIQLFEIEKTLGLLNEFDKANQIKDEANKLEEAEMQNAQLQMESDYELQRLTFENNYRKEVQNIEQIRQSQRDCLVARHKAEIKKVENRINVLNDHQRQIKRPKESSFEIQSRAPVNSSLISIIRGVSHSDNSNSNKSSSSNLNGNTNPRTASKLLPPLIPPNDSRIKERKKKEKRDRIEKNKKFREKMAAKEKEEEERYNESIAQNSQQEQNCFDDMLKRLGDLSSSKPQKNQKKKEKKLEDDSDSKNEPEILAETVAEIENIIENEAETEAETEKSTNSGEEASNLICSMIEKINDQLDDQPQVVASFGMDNLDEDENNKQEDGNKLPNVLNPQTFNLTQSPQFRTQKD